MGWSGKTPTSSGSSGTERRAGAWPFAPPELPNNVATYLRVRALTRDRRHHLCQLPPAAQAIRTASLAGRHCLMRTPGPSSGPLRTTRSRQPADREQGVGVRTAARASSKSPQPCDSLLAPGTAVEDGKTVSALLDRCRVARPRGTYASRDQAQIRRCTGGPCANVSAATSAMSPDAPRARCRQPRRPPAVPPRARSDAARPRATRAAGPC